MSQCRNLHAVNVDVRKRSKYALLHYLIVISVTFLYIYLVYKSY